MAAQDVLHLREKHRLGIGLGETLLATMPVYTDIYRSDVRNRIWPLELVPGESDAFCLKDQGQPTKSFRE